MKSKMVIYLSLMMLFQSESASASASASAEKVRVDLYYESLCPYCSAFILNGLSSLFTKGKGKGGGLLDIIELKLYPWGNAKILPDSDSVACQHGPPECLLNIVEACAIHAYPALLDHFPIIQCVERLAQARNYTSWEACFPNISKSVQDCTGGTLGNQLVLKYGAATQALNPPHQYVPWLVVNGQPLYDDYENFTTYVCKAYKGTPPTACNGESSSSYLREKTLDLHPVCYADTPTRSWMPQMIDSDVM